MHSESLWYKRLVDKEPDFHSKEVKLFQRFTAFQKIFNLIFFSFLSLGTLYHFLNNSQMWIKESFSLLSIDQIILYSLTKFSPSHCQKKGTNLTEWLLLPIWKWLWSVAEEPPRIEWLALCFYFPHKIGTWKADLKIWNNDKSYY